MTRPALALVLVLAACGEGRGPTPSDPAPRVVPPEPTPAPAPTASPSRPTAEAQRAARARCNDGWRAFGEGRLDDASAAIDAAIAVLERGEDHRVLGACLYNAGRVAESRGELDRARDLYDRSLTFRDDATVRARRAALGTVEAPAPEDRDLPLDPVLRRLMLAPGTGCARDAPCDFRITGTVESAGARIHVVSIRRDESGGDLASWDDLAMAFGAGTELWVVREQGATITWGPRLSHHAGDQGTQREIVSATATLRALAEGQPPLLVIDVRHAWEEQCCGGTASGTEDDLVVCATDRLRCVLIPKGEESTSESTEPDDPGYESGSSRWAATVTLDATGATVRTTTGTRPSTTSATSASTLTAWGEGAHPWSELLSLE